MIYKDIKKHPQKQVSGLRSAQTQFKIPRINRNIENLKHLLNGCVEYEAKTMRLDKMTRMQNKKADEARLFKFDFLQNETDGKHRYFDF